MSMTIIVTRNVSQRIRGFVSSSMLELAPGVYIAPRVSVAVRNRIWEVLSDWFPAEVEASIIMLWTDNRLPCGIDMKLLGLPSIDLVELDGLIVSRR